MQPTSALPAIAACAAPCNINWAFAVAIVCLLAQAVGNANAFCLVSARDGGLDCIPISSSPTTGKDSSVGRAAVMRHTRGQPDCLYLPNDADGAHIHRTICLKH